MIARYVTSTYEIEDTYKKIWLNAKDAKVKIESSDDDHTKLFLFEKKRAPYGFFIQDGTLTIQSAKTKWYHFLKIGIDRSEIRLCVPKATLEAISVRSNVGKVDISSIVCNGTIEVEVNTGRVNLENVFCKDFDSKGNTGSISLNQLIAKERIFIKRRTGKVILNDCAAPEISVKTNTGGVGGRLPANMMFIIRTNTGRVEIPKVPVGEAICGRCEIKTNTGNIRFE